MGVISIRSMVGSLIGRLALLSGVVEHAGLSAAHFSDDVRADGTDRHVLLSIEGDIDDG